MAKHFDNLVNQQSVVTVSLLDCDCNFVGTLNVPRLPQLPTIIVRGPRAFIQVEDTIDYQEQYAYFAPVAPFFLW